MRSMTWDSVRSVVSISVASPAFASGEVLRPESAASRGKLRLKEVLSTC